MILTIIKRRCYSCRYRWAPRTENPAQCPACKSRFWAVPKSKRRGRGRPKGSGVIHGHGANGLTADRPRSRTYSIYRNMLRRCTQSSAISYRNYGARGITVCVQWQGQNGFVKFLADMGTCPSHKVLERIDNAKGYSPENCKWATQSENCYNKRNNRLLTVKKRTQPLGMWAREVGLDPRTISKRINRGWDIERAVFQGNT